MKNCFLLVAALSLGASVLAPMVIAANAPATPSGGGVGKGELFHVVALKFKEGSTPEQIKGVEQAFAGLKQRIPQIKSLKWGTNVSPEKHDKGFTHGFVLSFASDADRDAYLVHPAHKEFGKTLGPVFGDVFVIDFWSKPE